MEGHMGGKSEICLNGETFFPHCFGGHEKSHCGEKSMNECNLTILILFPLNFFALVSFASIHLLANRDF